MKIIYRVNEIVEEYEDYYSYRNKIIIDQDVCICNDRSHFKEIMKNMYGENISFKNSKKLTLGDQFITIISEDCIDAEEYVLVNDFECSYCGRSFKQNNKMLKKFTYNMYHFKNACKEKYEEEKYNLEKMVFCCDNCLYKKENQIISNFKDYALKNNLPESSFISKSSFEGLTNTYGYIYLISNKTTGEFYVGQTMHVPIFRWGQHLLTKRFPLSSIVNYKFEVLEIIEQTLGCEDLLNKREAYWINKKRKENPTKSLNILIPKEDS